MSTIEQRLGDKAKLLLSFSIRKFQRTAFTCPDPILSIASSRYLIATTACWSNSGGAYGKNDLIEAVVTALINKRAGGTGLISGRKAFQRPIKEGIELLNAIQDGYLAREITIASEISMPKLQIAHV
jgi:hypothetical protein